MDDRVKGFGSLVRDYQSMVTPDMHWSNMHIVIEDGNIEDEHVIWCINEGVSDEERHVCDWLLKMPEMVRYAIWNVA